MQCQQWCSRTLGCNGPPRHTAASEDWDGVSVPVLTVRVAWSAPFMRHTCGTARHVHVGVSPAVSTLSCVQVTSSGANKAPEAFTSPNMPRKHECGPLCPLKPPTNLAPRGAMQYPNTWFGVASTTLLSFPTNRPNNATSNTTNNHEHDCTPPPDFMMVVMC